MKWNMVLGSMVVALGMCTQSFGFDLLDRMLGANGCGCEVSCCTSAGPSCAVPAAPTCAAPAPTCAAPIAPTYSAPTCGAEPTCAAQPGCDTGCCHKRRCGLNLKGLLGHRHCCKPVVSCGVPACAAPTCGAEPTCCAAPACHKHCHRPCLFNRLFACKSKCCGAPSCGVPACAAPTCGVEPNYGVAPEGKELPPMPPVPMDMQ